MDSPIEHLTPQLFYNVFTDLRCTALYNASWPANIVDGRLPLLQCSCCHLCPEPQTPSKNAGGTLFVFRRQGVVDPAGSPPLIALSKINSQLPVTEHGALQPLVSLRRRLNVDKIGMCKTARPAGSAINGDSHVFEVLDVAEKPVQLRIRSLKRNVADEELRRWWVRARMPPLPGLLFLPGNASDAPAVPKRAVDIVACRLEGLGRSEFDEAVSGDAAVLAPELPRPGGGNMRPRDRSPTYPLLRPRGSRTMIAVTTLPYLEKAFSKCSSLISNTRLRMKAACLVGPAHPGLNDGSEGGERLQLTSRGLLLGILWFGRRHFLGGLLNIGFSLCKTLLSSTSALSAAPR